MTDLTRRVGLSKFSVPEVTTAKATRRAGLRKFSTPQVTSAKATRRGGNDDDDCYARRR